MTLKHLENQEYDLLSPNDEASQYLPYPQAFLYINIKTW